MIFPLLLLRAPCTCYDTFFGVGWNANGRYPHPQEPLPFLVCVHITLLNLLLWATAHFLPGSGYLPLAAALQWHGHRWHWSFLFHSSLLHLQYDISVGLPAYDLLTALGCVSPKESDTKVKNVLSRPLLQNPSLISLQLQLILPKTPYRACPANCQTLSVWSKNMFRDTGSILVKS